MEEKLEQTLRRFLEEGKDWERRPTSVPGVFLMKLPGFKKSSPRLAAEINPVDSYGNPTKKRGLLVRTTSELEGYRKILSSEKLSDLLGTLEQVNPKVQEPRESPKEIIEL